MACHADGACFSPGMQVDTQGSTSSGLPRSAGTQQTTFPCVGESFGGSPMVWLRGTAFTIQRNQHPPTYKTQHAHLQNRTHPLTKRTASTLTKPQHATLQSAACPLAKPQHATLTKSTAHPLTKLQHATLQSAACPLTKPQRAPCKGRNTQPCKSRNVHLAKAATQKPLCAEAQGVFDLLMSAVFSGGALRFQDVDDAVSAAVRHALGIARFEQVDDVAFDTAADVMRVSGAIAP